MLHVTSDQLAEAITQALRSEVVIDVRDLPACDQRPDLPGVTHSRYELHSPLHRSKVCSPVAEAAPAIPAQAEQ